MEITRISKRAWSMRKYLAAKYRLQVHQIRWQFVLHRIHQIELTYNVEF